MSLNAAAIAVMVDRGMSAEDILAVAEALEIKRDPTAAERKRRQRGREKAERDMSHRDVTRDPVSPMKEPSTPSGTDIPDEASASSPVRQPIAEATEIWNREAAQAGWPQVRSLSANRQKLLAARLRQHGLDGWRSAIAKARASPYLAGHDPPSWFTFPWLIKAENFLKTIEGNYDRRRTEHRTDNPTAIAVQRITGAFGAHH